MIRKIELINFRNHEFISLDFDNRKSYIYGNNGVGKTAILEAIYFASTTKSMRTSNEKDLIKKDENFAKIKIIFENNKRNEVIISKTGKRLSANGVEKRRISDYIGSFNVVMFTSEDILLIKGTPMDKRNFIDLEWMLLDKEYLSLLNKYRKILKQRNALLKNIKIGDDYTFLNILGKQLLEVGTKIIEKRTEVIELLNEELKKLPNKFDIGEIEIVYKPDQTVKGLKNWFETKQDRDIIYESTNAGPHKDDFIINISGKDSKIYASQGEQRLIVIAVKIALLQLITRVSKQKPILLLDDILSELDERNQKLFLNNLPKENQIIMTSVKEIKPNDKIQTIKIEGEMQLG